MSGSLKVCSIICILFLHARATVVKDDWNIKYLITKEACDFISINKEAQSPYRGRSIIAFQNVPALSRASENPNFMSSIASTSCLVTTVETSSENDIMTLFDIMNKIRLIEKYLFIETTVLNYNFLQNKTINYKVFINHLWKGSCIMTTSLCPTLGKTHAEVFNGSCPLSLESPQGKELKVSFIGTSPYITFNRSLLASRAFGGSEVDLIHIFAQKFKFTPNFIPEKSFDPVQVKGKTYGMFHQVSIKESEIGIGQSGFSTYRNKLVDFLPNMYMHEFIMMSKKPHEIASFDTIIYPFDSFIWIFTLSSMLAVFIMLFLMQNSWHVASGMPYSSDYVFEDLFVAIVFIPRRKLRKWIQRQGFCARKFAILKWIFMSHVLILGYKATLLSTLIPIRYSDRINSLEDMDRSGLPLLVPNGTAVYKSMVGDKRRIVQQIYNRSLVYQYTGTRENIAWFFEKVNSGNGVGVVVSAGWTRLELRNEYHFSKENVFATHSSDIVPKGSPLKTLFQNATMWLRDSGVLNKLRYDVLNPPIPIPDPKVRHNQPLNNWQLGIIMIIYLAGVLISVLVFLAELLKFNKIRPETENAPELKNNQVAHEYEPRPTKIYISLIE